MRPLLNPDVLFRYILPSAALSGNCPLKGTKEFFFIKVCFRYNGVNGLAQRLSHLSAQMVDDFLDLDACH